MLRPFISKLIITVCVVIGLGIIAALALPFIIDAFILPPLLEKTPFSSPQASISRLTPYSMSGSVNLEHQGKPSLMIPQFKLRFTPGNLLNKKIDALELTHADFHLYREQDRWLFPAETSRHASHSESPADQLFLLPLGVDTLILKQCRLILHNSSGKDLHIGVNAHIEPDFNNRETGHLLKSINGSLLLSDDVVATTSFTITVNDDDIDSHLNLENGNIFLPDGVLPDMLKPFMFNSLSARMNVNIDTHTFALKQYDLNGNLTAMSYKTDQVAVDTDSNGDRVGFSLSGNNREHSYEISSLPLKYPVQADLDINGTASYKDNRLHTEGIITSILTSTNNNKADHKAGEVEIPVSLHYTAEWSQEAGYHITTSGDFISNQPLALLDDSLIISLDKLQFSGTVTGDAKQAQGHLNLKSEPITIAYDTQEIKMSAIDLAVAGTRIDNQYAAGLSGALASIDLPAYKVRLEKLNFNLPYATATLPALPDTLKNGSITIDSVLLNDEKLATFSAAIAQQEAAYNATGSIDALFNPDLHILFDAESSLSAGTGHINWKIDPVDITPESLPEQVFLPIDLDFSGVVNASGTIDVDTFKVAATMKSSIHDGAMELSDSDLSIEAINCAVEFPELPRLSSSPSQYCSTGGIDLAALHFDDAAIYYRVENSQSIFIEKSRFSWCEGTLDSGSLRLSQGDPELDTTLYCSRIQLGSLLEQFGFKGTEGEGSLNGTLPIRLSENSLEFNDGFLFSTPGTGGIVRFTDTELLRQGMGSVSETGYISYSLAALEDFTYNWTKLSFDSSDDDLLLTLELDGKPTTPLPFKFDKKGMIVESGMGKGLQYPVRLDVNFRLPLAELFQIGQSINSLTGNSQ